MKFIQTASGWKKECDILIPAALEDVINKDNADKIKASLLVEAANIPTTPEADEILRKKGVDVAVDFITNMGGIPYLRSNYLPHCKD